MSKLSALAAASAAAAADRASVPAHSYAAVGARVRAGEGNEAILTAMPRVAEEPIDEGVARPAHATADFRQEAEVLTIHRGEPYFIAVCHELIDGRWEGFVSMRRAPLVIVEAR